MGTLRDIVGDGAKRQQVVEDAVKVLDAEVSDKGGLGGIALKAAYAMVKGLAPGMVPKLMNGLLDDFLGELEPFYDDGKKKGKDFKSYLTERQSEVANALLKVTDLRAQRSSAASLKKGYEKLRPAAQKHVEQALPRLAELVSKYAP